MNNIFSPMINKLSLVSVNSIKKFYLQLEKNMNINVFAIKLSNILTQSEYLNKYD